MTVARWLGNSSGRREKAAVLNMADPTPSVILSSIQKRMNTQPEGIMAVKLCVTTRRKNTNKPFLNSHPTESLHLYKSHEARLQL